MLKYKLNFLRGKISRIAELCRTYKLSRLTCLNDNRSEANLVGNHESAIANSSHHIHHISYNMRISHILIPLGRLLIPSESKLPEYTILPNHITNHSKRSQACIKSNIKYQISNVRLVSYPCTLHRGTIGAHWAVARKPSRCLQISTTSSQMDWRQSRQGYTKLPV